ncbi:MAG: ATP-binding protein [Aristaeellaceae bacterium]
MSAGRENGIRRMLFGLQRFFCFFLVVGMIVTCCTMLFVTNLQSAMGLVFTEADIQQAAKLTFLNVLLLTAAFAVIDRIRRRYMVTRPVRMIIGTAQKLMQGDFSARVPQLRSIDTMDGFTEIGACINRLAEELSGTETLRTDFIANVSHELKTPLAVISNYAAMLAQPGLAEAQRMEYARKISETSRRLANLITNILKLNKLENQQIFPKNARFDLGEQLCECLLSFEDAWEKKGLDIRTDIAEGVELSGDAELLCLVWSNLFSNAIKFTNPGGCVTLRMFAEGDSAVVQVSDTGCGFGGEVGRHIFEKFYQGDPSHAMQGNGLGLALVKRVVDIVGGDISVNSEVGKGSAFTVRIGRNVRE